MTIKVVNSSPGDTTDPYVPGDPLHIGLRSTTAKVDPASIQYDLALSCLINNGALPENDTKLTNAEAIVSLVSPELEQPITGEISRTLTNGNLVLTKVGAGARDKAIYTVKVPVETGASVLGHIRFRVNTAWQSINPDWCNLTNLKGLYFGLEHGPFNTAAYAFLRDDGLNGTIVVGGPQQGPTLARPAQTELASLDPTVAAGWKTLANGTAIDLFILFNTYTNPYAVEIWAASPADGVLRRIAWDTIENLGTFPVAGSGSNNIRPGPSNFATLHFGLSGLDGDVLTIEDWGLFPSFQRMAADGSPLTNAGLQLSPNGPVRYSASNGVLPSKTTPARWLSLSDGLPANASLYLQPGIPSRPLHVSIDGAGSRSGFQRNEPRLETRIEGAVFEAILSGVSTSRSGSGTSMGIGIEDGLNSYQVLLIEDPNIRTLGLLKDATQPDTLASYATVGKNDWTRPQLVRLAVDRIRSEILIYAGQDDSTPALILPFGTPTPPSAATTGRMIAGFLTNPASHGQLNIQSLLYLTRYLGWEGRDGLLPTNVSLPAPIAFSAQVSGAGSSTMVGSSAVVTKPDFGVIGSHYIFQKDFDFHNRHGLLVDFKTVVNSYTNEDGTPNAPLTDTGVWLACHNGTQVICLGFYDCGLAGKKIAILPGSGTADDIVNQTSLGVKFSASVDWSVKQSYRLVVKPYESIQVWAGSVTNEPVLTIPWVNDRFDLPVSSAPAPCLQFGHFYPDTSSVSSWDYVRWGCSDGYDAAMTPKYPEEKPGYLFGGKTFSALNFSEVIS